MEQILEEQKTSLKYAWKNKVRKGDIRYLLDKLQEILNVEADTTVYQYIRGERIPDIIEGKAIEDLFKEYGIEICWNCDEPEKEYFS